jgi:PhnB protein
MQKKITMESIVPYLTFNGRTKEAFEFYAKALRGEILHLQTFGDIDSTVSEADRHRVMHAILKSGELTLMASDTKSADTETRAGDMISLSMNFTDEKSIEHVYAALSVEAEIIMPLQDTFWNARFGILRDQFGIQWMFNYDKPKND